MNRLTSLILLSLALGLAACGGKPAPAVAPPPADPVVQGQQLRFPAGHPQLSQLGVVAAAPAHALAIDLPARLVWNEDRTQRIYPAFAGRVSRIDVDVGQAVKPGAVLAQLASPDFGMAQADTAKAAADAQFTQRALVRQRELFEAGVVARKDLEQAEADAARARAEVQRAEARTRLYGGQGGVDQHLALVSTLGGVVVERNLNPGQELRPDQMGPGTPPLFTVSDPSSLWVVIDVREAEAGALQPGTEFELLVPSLPGEKFTGRVTSTGDFIDPNTRTLRVRGLVPNPGRQLKAEMLVTARVMRQPGSGVIVPSRAVILEGSQHRVVIEVAPGAFQVREVDVASQSRGEALIRGGLQAGEKVVSENVLLLARQYRAALDAAMARPGAASPAVPAALDAAAGRKP